MAISNLQFAAIRKVVVEVVGTASTPGHKLELRDSSAHPHEYELFDIPPIGTVMQITVPIAGRFEITVNASVKSVKIHYGGKAYVVDVHG